MNNENLLTYLNDHLAGSVGALELLNHMKDSAREKDFESFCASLHHDIQSDQNILRDVIEQLGGGAGKMKGAAAWILEKAGWTKMKLAGFEKDELGRLQALEGLALGITGKKALWVSLAALAHPAPPLKGIDIARLISRAEEQFARVESERVKAAEASLS